MLKPRILATAIAAVFQLLHFFPSLCCAPFNIQSPRKGIVYGSLILGSKKIYKLLKQIFKEYIRHNQRLLGDGSSIQKGKKSVKGNRTWHENSLSGM